MLTSAHIKFVSTEWSHSYMQTFCFHDLTLGPNDQWMAVNDIEHSHQHCLNRVQFHYSMVNFLPKHSQKTPHSSPVSARHLGKINCAKTQQNMNDVHNYWGVLSTTIYKAIKHLIIMMCQVPKPLESVSTYCLVIPLLPWQCGWWGFCKILEQSTNSKPIIHGFEILQDLVIKCFLTWWVKSLDYVFQFHRHDSIA